jgi:hypothetical protein
VELPSNHTQKTISHWHCIEIDKEYIAKDFKSGYNIIYHRLGSIRESKILDHYQAVDTNGRYHELYIDPYADEMMRVPPNGN